MKLLRRLFCRKHHFAHNGTEVYCLNCGYTEALR